MRRVLIPAIALFALAGCSYRTMEACEEATGGTCHESILGGVFPGRGIDVNSPAGQAILSGVIAGMNRPAQQPYVLPMPQVPARTGFSCTYGSGIMNCN